MHKAHFSISALCFIILSCWIREGLAGYCRETYSCSKTCYVTENYQTKCGIWNWARCTAYRRTSKSCSSTCYRNKCCPGYTGVKCETPLCPPGCKNGGTCVSPGVCSCPQGFKEPYCDDIDECATGESRCQQLCTNTQGSYICSCRPGYHLFTDKKTCVDINECLTNNGGCQHLCSNTDGSYACGCYEGHSLTTSHECTDNDECQLGNANCSHVCVNTQGSYHCTCRKGFVLSSDERSCEDIDECANTPPFCEQTCHNSIGSFTCGCRSGFTLANDSRTCDNIDDCKGVICQNHGTCIDGINNYICECIPGFKGQHCENDCVADCGRSLDGDFPSCITEYGYVSCSNGHLYERPCPDNLIWNDGKKQCDWAHPEG